MDNLRRSADIRFSFRWLREQSWSV